MPTRTNHGQAATANAANNTTAASAANSQSTQTQQNGNTPVSQQNQAPAPVNQAPVSQLVAQPAQVYPYACADMFAGIFSAMASAFAAVGQQPAPQQANSTAQNGAAQTAPASAPQQNQGGQNGGNGNQSNGGNQNGSGNQGNGGQNGGNTSGQTPAPQTNAGNSNSNVNFMDWTPVRMYTYWVPELGLWAPPIYDLFGAKQAGNGFWEPVWCKVRKADGVVLGYMTKDEIAEYTPDQLPYSVPFSQT